MAQIIFRPSSTQAGRLPGLQTVLALAMVVATLASTPIAARAQEFGPDLQINSKRYIVIDAETGEVFASRNADEEVAMASLTKVFTAIQALEDGDLDQVIVTDESDMMDSTNSTMGFAVGESFTLEDLLYGLMLPSGNDAAHAIARTLGSEPGDSPDESVERFVARMNQRIKDLGLTNTTLINASGYGVPGHFTTAHDLATWMMYALQYPMFETLISSLEHTTTTGQYLRNNNRLMTMGFAPLVGGKTGYDMDSGYCLIEVARRNGNTMISVTLDGVPGDDWYDDNRVLLNYALDAKEEREADNEPITNPTLSFLDPDAAVIARTAAGGGSVGGALPAPAAATDAAAGAGDTTGMAPNTDAAAIEFSNASTIAPGFGQTTGAANIWVVLGVVSLVIGARVMGALAAPGLSPVGGRRRQFLWFAPPSDDVDERGIRRAPLSSMPARK